MIKEVVLGAVSVTSLFLNNPNIDQLTEAEETTPAITYNLSEYLNEDESSDVLSVSERLLYMRPASAESKKSKSIKESVKKELEEKEEERAKEETKRLTEEEMKKAEKEWNETFPKYDDTTPQGKFLNAIARDAVEIAYKNNIYPSVMIAQAALESNWGRSGLAKNYNNLMGTKGSWKGKSVNMRTREDVGGESIYINAGFSVYDSWKDSLERYGQLLRNGPNGNASFYAGAWKSNTKTYKEATQWLQGRYATDTQYAAKLNRTIDMYDLAQFDSIIPLDEELKEIEVKVEPEKVLLEAPKGVYEVKEGDSLFSIALAHDLTFRELRQLNALQSPLLEEKQWLVVSLDELTEADEEEREVFNEIIEKNRNAEKAEQENKKKVASEE